MSGVAVKIFFSSYLCSHRPPWGFRIDFYFYTRHRKEARIGPWGEDVQEGDAPPSILIFFNKQFRWNDKKLLA